MNVVVRILLITHQLINSGIIDIKTKDQQNSLERFQRI